MSEVGGLGASVTTSAPTRLEAAGLVRVIRRLAAAPDLLVTMEIVTQAVRSLLKADGATFVLKDGDLCHYADEHAVAPLWKGRRFPMSACISGWCMQNDQAVAIPDIYKDVRIPHDAYRPTFVRSLAMAPVRQRKPFAAIGAYWSQPRDIGADELDLLQTLADASGLAISVAQLEPLVEARRAAEAQEQHLKLLVNELNHRVKNTLATVQSLAAQTLRGAADPDEAYRRLEGRIMGLSAAHNVLTERNWAGATLAEIAERTLRPFTADNADRIRSGGVDIWLGPQAAVALSLALHELATNALKYGSLSTLEGGVTLTWTVDRQNGALEIRWVETGGPRVVRPERTGFGSRLIERSLARELGAPAMLSFEPGGLVCTIGISAGGYVAPPAATPALT